MLLFITISFNSELIVWVSIFHPSVHSVWISCWVFLRVVLIVVVFNVSCVLCLCSISTAGVWRVLYMLLNQTTSTRRINAQEPLCSSEKLTCCHMLTSTTWHIYTWTETRKKKEQNIQPQIKCEVYKVKIDRFLTKKHSLVLLERLF